MHGGESSVEDMDSSNKRKGVDEDRLNAIGRLVTRGLPVTEASVDAEYGPDAATRHGIWVKANTLGRLPGPRRVEALVGE